MEQKCYIHVDWFFGGHYTFDDWLKDQGWRTWYHIEVTRYQYDTIRSMNPKGTNTRDQNTALVETLKNLLDKYELVERRK